MFLLVDSFEFTINSFQFLIEMEENKMEIVKNILDKNEINVNICYSSGNCVTCRYFDPKYHDGYCDYHKCDTNPGATCKDYWAK